MTGIQNQQPVDTSELSLKLELEIEPEANPEPAYQDERRRTARPVRSKAGGYKGYIRKFTDSLVGKIGSGWQGWTVLSAIICGASMLLGWSLAYRTHHLDQNFELIAALTERRTVFSELLTKWSHEDLNKLRTRVSNAESRVFPGYEKLAAWLNSQAIAADQLGMDMRYTMQPPQPSQIAQVAEIPIEIQITTKELNHGQSYLSMLEFIKSVVDDQWHIDIASALMNGQGNGAGNLTSTIRVWVRDLQLPVALSDTDINEKFTQ